MKKHIVFVCATGIATSTAVAEKVMNYLEKEKGLNNISYTQTNVASIKSNIDNADLVVATTKIPYEIDVPVIRGLAFLTGIGEQKVLDNIYETIKGGQ